MLLDRQLQRMSRRMTMGLAKLIRRRKNFAKEATLKAQKIVAESGFTTSYLAEQWELQREAELSVRARKHFSLPCGIC